MKRCGLVIRVSTDRQAKNPEGSLTNQLQKLHAHVEYKNTVGGEEWSEGGRYVLKAVSGKDSMRSKEFAQLFEDMKTGKVNTVVCTALDRISRSVRDFLNFFEILTKYNVEFVCLKQNYDTTTSQGKLFITIMMALAEFEREQTSERTREAVMARAERGLWNGSQLFGYDLPPEKKGTLIPNPQEAAIVNVTFDYYLTCGSIFETAKELNRRGYRLKSYTSRRDVYHAPKPFTYTGVHVMLTNAAYIGMKEINKKLKRGDQETLPEAQRYRLVKAAWPPIVEQVKFEQAQKLMAVNDRSNRNAAKPIRHTYVLNGGLLWCEVCGSEMEGRSGTSHHRQVYFYYKCKNAVCGFKAPAEEVESIVLRRIRQLATRTDLLADMVGATNAQLQEELPRLREQQLILKQELEKIQQAADRLMDTWTQMASTDGKGFLKDKLEALGKRRKEIEVGLDTLGATIAEIEREAVNQEQVIGALQQVSQVFETLPPYEQKDLFRHTLHKALISPDRLKLALYGKPPQQPVLQTTRANAPQNGDVRSEPFEWLPECASIRRGHPGWAEPEVWFRVVHVTLENTAGSAAYREQTVEVTLGPKGAFENGNIGTLTRQVPANRVISAVPPPRGKPKPLKVPRTPLVVEFLRKALEWQMLLASGQAKNQADIARQEGISRVRVTQVMWLLRLTPEIQEHVLAMSETIRRPAISERALRPIARLEDVTDQKARFHRLIGEVGQLAEALDKPLSQLVQEEAAQNQSVLLTARTPECLEHVPRIKL